MSVFLLCISWVSVALPADTLLDVAHPDFDQFEPGVRARMNNAVIAIDHARNRDPYDEAALGQAYGELGMLYHAYALLVPAQAAYQNARTLQPEDTIWTYLLAFLMHGDGDFERAIALYEAVLTQNPNFLPARIHLAQAYFSIDRLADSEREFAASLNQNPASAAALYGLGGIALRQQQPEAAIDLYERALAIEPDATHVHYNLAQAYRKTGNRDAARKHLEQRGNVRPSVNDPILARMQAKKVTSQEFLKDGLDAYEEGRYADAVVAYTAALELKPDDPYTMLSLAWVIELADDDTDAMRHVDAALALDPDFAQAYFSKGAMLEEAGDDNTAIAHYRKAVTLEPDAYPPRLLLANALMRTSAFREAAAQYSILTNQQSDDVLLFRLAHAQQKSGDCATAAQTIATALETNSSSATLMQAYVRIVASCDAVSGDMKNHAFAVAQRLFQSLRNLESGETLAMAAIAVGRFDQAIGLQEQIVRQLDQEQRSTEFAQQNLVLYRRQKIAAGPWPQDSDVYKPPRVTLRDRMAIAGISR